MFPAGVDIALYPYKPGMGAPRPHQRKTSLEKTTVDDNQKPPQVHGFQYPKTEFPSSSRHHEPRKTAATPITP